ncbi:MAG: hypothetical protein QM775_25270 [Pirellulales bacterium]
MPPWKNFEAPHTSVNELASRPPVHDSATASVRPCSAELVGHHLHHAVMAEAHEIIAEQHGALVGEGPQRGRGILPVGRADAAVDLAEVRAERDAEAGMPVEERLEFRLERRLADAGGADLDVSLALGEQPARGQARDDLLGEHRAQFIRRPRQHDEHLAILLDPEAGRGAVGVGQHFAALELVGLLEIVGRGHAVELREALRDRPLDGGIEHQFLAERLREHVARAVVAGRPEPAGRDDDVGLRPALAELRGDGVGFVGDGHVARQLHAAAAEFGADPRQVAVGRQSEQQLIAQREQFVARGDAGARGFDVSDNVAIQCVGGAT